MSNEEAKESVNRETKPYRAEYAASNRAKCKKCDTNIPKDSLKLAYMVKSRFHDGYDAKHHHLDCFFQIKRPKSIAEIGNFEKLKYEDQKLLEKALESNGATVLENSLTKLGSKTANSKKAVKREASTNVDTFNYSDFTVELAKSNRSTCVSCQEKIPKESIRFGKLDFDVDMDAVYAANGPLFRWHHINCFAKNCQELEFYGNVTKIPGFKNLEKDDRKVIEATVKPKPKEEVKKPKKESSDEDEREERRLKRQSDKYYALKEYISTMKKSHMSEMLDYMKQKSDFRHGSLLVDMATDVMLFGPLEPCPKCRGRLILKSSAYICTGGTEDEPCNFETRDPNRGAPDVPNDIVEAYPFFANEYVFKPRKRIFPSKLVKATENRAAEEGKVVNEDSPLYGLCIGVTSWKYILIDKTKVEGRIKALGAKLQTTIDKNLFMILTSEEEVAKNNPKLEVAKALDIPFVKAKCLFDIKSDNDVVLSMKDNIVDTYSDDLSVRYEKFKSMVSANNNL